MLALRHTAMLPSERQISLTNALKIIPDPQERLAALVARTYRQPPLPAEDRRDANLVPGCVSRVWMACACENGRCRFRCAADSPLVAALVGLLCEIYDDAPPEEIVRTEPAILADVGVLQSLSPTRQNGLAAVRNRIRSFAQACLTAAS
jgi:cysteine desulfuration protein SufE